ncbi:MAG: DUF3656 domain-containing U32 family peptidase [Bacillota bacterium]|jgi:putative protease
MEILSPAGNFEAFLAAVHNGADAVYLGGKTFGARAFAGNFGLEEIAEAVKYAHLRKIKVYVTVNTLITDEEMESAVKFVIELYNIGVDAIIIQDWGLINILRKNYPQIPLNASTQMTMHNSEACQMAEEIGFKRAILSRETSIEEMRKINSKVNIETEVFVHGALCICYSGQCLFSSLVGGRSGNRGRCAQPCRLKYQLFDGKGNKINQAHLLSPKDLNGVWNLQDIEAAGVVSAKIEGRMKRPEYVATVVSAYAKANRGEDLQTAEKELEQAFNREFTTGYMLKNQGADLMSYNRPNNRGTKLGRIEKILANGILLKLEDNLALNDGVEIWVSKGGRQGFTVDNLSIEEIEVEDADRGSEVFINTINTDLNLKNIRTGDRVFKTLDYRLNRKARATFEKYDTLPVSMKLIAHAGENVTLRLIHNKKQVEYTEESFTVPIAQKHPATMESVNKQLSRLGGTGWYLSYLELEIDDNIMLPASVLNNCRRAVIQMIEDKLLAEYKREPINYKQTVFTQTADNYNRTLIAAAVEDNRSARAAIDGGADIVYINALSFRGKKPIEDEEILRLIGTGTPIYMILPVIAKEGELAHWQKQLKRFENLGVKGIVAGNPWAVHLAKKMNYQGEIVGDFGLNYFNSQSADFWRSQGISQLGISNELNFKQIAGLKGNIRKEALVFGNLQMMITEHCVLGAVCGGRTADRSCCKPCLKDNRFSLRDEKGFSFPVKADSFCRNHIYNGHLLCMIEDMTKFAAMQIDVLRLDLLHFRDREIREITEAFHLAIQMAMGGFEYDYSASKKKITEIIKKPLTKGHYYRGVE